MVTVLRAPGPVSSDLSPQPTVERVPLLIEDSGLDVSLRGTLPKDLPTAVQRAIYRTVQEGLTNVRKYAMGSKVQIILYTGELELSVQVVNSAGTEPDLVLPGSRHGLRGLTERAELLEGHLSSRRHPDGGFTLELRLPLSPHQGLAVAGADAPATASEAATIASLDST